MNLWPNRRELLSESSDSTRLSDLRKVTEHGPVPHFPGVIQEKNNICLFESNQHGPLSGIFSPWEGPEFERTSAIQ